MLCPRHCAFTCHTVRAQCRAVLPPHRLSVRSLLLEGVRQHALAELGHPRSTGSGALPASTHCPPTTTITTIAVAPATIAWVTVALASPSLGVHRESNRNVGR